MQIFIDVSEESIASIFRVTLEVSVNIIQKVWCHIADDNNVHCQFCETFKFCNFNDFSSHVNQDVGIQETPMTT
jgi:hypothetical protein